MFKSISIKHMPQDITKKTGCCNLIDPKKWDRKTINWRKKLFLKDSVSKLFHIPINMGSKISKNSRIIKKNGAEKKEFLMLTDEKSMWSADIYIDVKKKIDGANMQRITGKFITRVFEGPYKNIPTWKKEMYSYAKSKNKKIKKIYFFYTTCPRCVKAYKKNYVVIFARIH